MYLEQGIRTICLDQGIVFRWRDCKFIDQGNMYLDQGIIQIDKELYNGLFKGKGIVYLDWGSGSGIFVYVSWSSDYINKGIVYLDQGFICLDWGSGSGISVYLSWLGDYIKGLYI